MKWVSLPQLGDVPLARSSHSISVVEDGKKIVLIGGEHAPRLPVTTDVSIYTIESGIWSTVSANGAPCLRVAHAAAAVGNKVYVHGGRTEVQEESTLGDFHVFDVATNTWTELHPTGPCPMPRNYHSACSLGASVYIFGGCGAGGRLSDLWRYDTVANEWEELPSSDAIKGRGGPGFVAAAGALWVMGGFTGQEASDIHRFDLTTKTWTQVEVQSAGNTRFTARSVFGRGGHSCSGGHSCGHADHILVFGGEIDPSDLGHAGAGQFSSATFCMDPVALSWHDVAVTGDAPGPRGWCASAELPGRGVIVSGGINDDNDRLRDLFLLDFHHN